mmetsp:Transcript_13546/g.21137  ORF Transcript_13546/g.21137 Transcript_13546/m.21137 type:complete len:129 (+) Transcript_13546:842-1228(+)|eukprot:CAMPEP_0170487542 /NCGR_PEP_ID=MMETSP0208-20121228/6335_1 /TAXON_ID=197538 /ORGANISM="Strombidium inclinatum, Strain S3" /LENGTH=128 /DNA_ID=CAMNT_0010761861 /DNA_START=808 /DNA_END=1194 /DNA_ORIENTATION=+
MQANYFSNNPHLSIEDFDSKNLTLTRVPKAASQTCQGQVLLKPVIKPVPYTGIKNRLLKSTIDEFRLTKKEQELSQGTNLHRFNHVNQNIKLASSIRQLYGVRQSFKKSVLSKSNEQNLRLIKELKST